MQAPLSLPCRTNLVVWLLALAGVGALGLLVASSHLGGSSPSPTPAVLPSDKPLVAYLQFGPREDTLWLTDPGQPARRQKLFALPHATAFGVVPSLAPDGRRFAYAALPPGLRAPSPDTPAELWLAAVSPEESRLLLARDVDLLVRAVWRPDGGSLVFRRSDAASRLYSFDLTTNQERELVAVRDAGLFPVAFSPDATTLYHVRLQDDGSYLAAYDIAAATQRDLGRLSNGLTRDWTLSPDGSQLAYLAMNLDGSLVSSTAHIFDLATGEVRPVGEAFRPPAPDDQATQSLNSTSEPALSPPKGRVGPGLSAGRPDSEALSSPSPSSERGLGGEVGDAFSPVWLPDGDLAFGHLTNRTAGGISLRGHGDAATTLVPPTRGFDVPLAFSAAARRFAVRTFDGASATSPGRATLTVVGLDGARTPIATGEVTFLGWID
jgi:hypothetical protein